MALTRRDLLKYSGLGLGAVLFAGCSVPEREFLLESPLRMPEDLVEGADAHYATLARSGSRTEGVLVRVMQGRAKKIEGNPDYPLSRGAHSPQAEAVLQALYHPDRISGPMKRDGDGFRPVSWDEALNELVGGLRDLSGSPDRVVLLTEPLRGHLGAVVQRFARGYGARHVAFDTLEDTTLRAAVKQVFGGDGLPYFDIQNARYVLSFGADFLGTWLSPVQYGWQYGEFRQGAGRERGTLVQVEPRFSLTAANADEWVPAKPGTEGLLALSIAAVIMEEGLGDRAAMTALRPVLTDAVLTAARPDAAAAATGVEAGRIREIARAFASHQPGIALGGGLAGAQTNGQANLAAVYLLNVLVGNVGKPGGVVLNPSGPLDAAVGAAGATPFTEMWRLVGDMGAGRVGSALVHGANPAYGLPGQLGFAEALRSVPFVVSFSSFMDETTAAAHLILPDRVSLETWGDEIPDPAPGYQAVAFQQPVVEPFSDSQDFGDLLLAVAEELGGGVRANLPWGTMRDALRDGARQLYGLNRGSLRRGSPDAGTFEEFWVGLLQRGGWWDTGARSTTQPPAAPEGFSPPGSPAFDGDERTYPFHLLPFPSQSLGDGSGANLPWLQAMPDSNTTVVWDTWVEVNPGTAADLGVREGDVVEVASAHGTIEVRVYVHPATPPDVVSIPLGQGHDAYGRYAEGRGANVLRVLGPQTDEATGALAWGATRVRLRYTGRRGRLSKFEGTVDAIALPGVPVVQVTRGT